jgi:outer membrane protein
MRSIKPVWVISNIVIIIFASHHVFAADVAKIGVIDLQKILETSAGGKFIQSELKKQKDTMEADLKKKGTEIENIRKRLERESMVMGKEKREEKERESRIKINDFKSLQKKYRSDLQKLEGKLMQQLSDDINAIVDEIGKKEGYLLIINKLGVIYSPNSIDITDKIIGKLNTKFTKKKQK